MGNATTGTSLIKNSTKFDLLMKSSLNTKRDPLINIQWKLICFMRIELTILFHQYSCGSFTRNLLNIDTIILISHEVILNFCNCSKNLLSKLQTSFRVRMVSELIHFNISESLKSFIDTNNTYSIVLRLHAHNIFGVVW